MLSTLAFLLQGSVSMCGTNRVVTDLNLIEVLAWQLLSCSTTLTSTAKTDFVAIPYTLLYLANNFDELFFLKKN